MRVVYKRGRNQDIINYNGNCDCCVLECDAVDAVKSNSNTGTTGIMDLRFWRGNKIALILCSISEIDCKNYLKKAANQGYIDITDRNNIILWNLCEELQ